MGADINSNITRKTHFVIIGDNPGPRKMETLNKLRFDGYSITTLSEDDLNRIFEGNLCKNNPVGQQSSSKYREK